MYIVKVAHLQPVFIHKFLYSHTHTYTYTHTHTHTYRRELEKEAVLHAAAVKTVKTAGEVTRQTSSTLSPHDNGSLRSSSNETSRSSSPSSNVADKKSVRQQKAGQVGGALPQVDIKAWTKQIERDIIRTDRSHPYYKGDSKILNDLHDKTLL